jgi:two-component sensor histidine kinase
MLARSVESGNDLVAEAHHRVANSLTLLSGLVRMQAQTLAKLSQPLSAGEARVLLDGIAARIVTVSQLHRLLARIPSDDALVDLGSHLDEVCRTLVDIVSSPRHSVRLELIAQDCRISARQFQPVTLILCDIIINAIKYAHPAGLAVHLRIHCYREDGALTIAAGDDGVGLPENFDTLRDGGLGFRVIRSLSAQLGADLKIDSSALGVSFRLRVPAADGS